MPENGQIKSNGTEGHVQNASNEQELITKTLQIQKKRFYLDVKQNLRGRFIKIAEVGNGGRKSRILMSMQTASVFRDRLQELNEVYNQLAPHEPDHLAPGGRLKSDSIVQDNRRYYLDLKENGRGRFLRVTMTTPTSRAQIAIPAQGMIELCNALVDLIKEFGEAEEGQEGRSSELPESKSLRVESKMFYFDVGSNRRGVFLRISEVRANCRTAVTIPDRSWGKFRDIVNEFAEKLALTGGKAELGSDVAATIEDDKEGSDRCAHFVLT